MYRILLPVDTDESRALAQADYVAELPDAADSVEVILLFVFDESDDDIPDEYKRFNTATRIGAVRRASERLEEAGVEVHVLDESGDAATRILEEAEERAVDSIVIGGRKRSAVGKAIFGSVTMDVIRGTSLPVTVTGKRE